MVDVGEISEKKSRTCELMRGTNRGTSYHQGARWLDNILKIDSAHLHEIEPKSSLR